MERPSNKETIELAVKIRLERDNKFKENMHGYRLKKDRAINFLDHFQSYIDGYTKKDIRMLQGVLSGFESFLANRLSATDEIQIDLRISKSYFIVRFEPI